MRHIFYNAKIITMENEQLQQAMLIENGLFQKVGSNEELLTYSEGATVIDLKGQTVLPAFIDAHSHFSGYASSLLQASMEDAGSYAEIIERLQLFVRKNSLKPGQWIVAGGYDHNQLQEKLHPTRQLLDRYFPDFPVVLQHKSGHFGVFNSMALAAVGAKDINSNGYLEETVYVEAVKKVPLSDQVQLLEAYKRTLECYASYGITTLQEGMMIGQMQPLYQMLVEADCLTLDIVGFPDIAEADKLYEAFSRNKCQYDRHFRLGGYKIILDGSPQGRTAWMKTPYMGSRDEYGISTRSDEAVTAALQKAVADGRQLLVHCNGDAAAEQLLRCAESIENKSGLAKIRPVMIHAQLLARNQLERVRQLGIIPSFFVAHCYHWGDTHIKNFGFQRAAQCSPAKSALDKKLLFTFHQDAPVIEPNMLETVWCAVNRRTKAGVVLGKEERISVIEALKAVTVNAAYQYGEEKKKGSIAAGKNADFVVLDRNPLEIPPEELNTITVLATWKSGKCVFKKA